MAYVLGEAEHSQCGGARATARSWFHTVHAVSDGISVNANMATHSAAARL